MGALEMGAGVDRGWGCSVLCMESRLSNAKGTVWGRGEPRPVLTAASKNGSVPSTRPTACPEPADSAGARDAAPAVCLRVKEVPVRRGCRDAG